MNFLPDSVDMRTWPASLGGLYGLGRFKPKRLGKLVPKPIAKFASKALAPVAMAANIIPGVGPVVSVGLTAAAAAQKAQKAKQRQKAAMRAAAAAQQAEAAEQFTPAVPQYEPYDNAEVPQYALPAIPTTYAQPFADTELPAELPEAVAEQLPPAPVFPEDLGLDWSELFNQASNVVSQVAPKVLEQAQSGAFGKAAQRLAGSRAATAGAAIARSVTLRPATTTTTTTRTVTRGGRTTATARTRARRMGATDGGGLGPLLAGAALVYVLARGGTGRKARRR